MGCERCPRNELCRHSIDRNEWLGKLRITMARSLVIVESPAKAKTINKYLGRDYSVKASYGHVMDLPRKELGILMPDEEPGNKKKARARGKAKAGGKADEKKTARLPSIDDANIFEPTLQIIPGKGKIIKELRKAA